MSRHDNEKLKFVTVNIPRPLLRDLDNIKKKEERRTGYRISRSNMIIRIISKFVKEYKSMPKSTIPASHADCIPPLPEDIPPIPEVRASRSNRAPKFPYSPTAPASKPTHGPGSAHYPSPGTPDHANTKNPNYPYPSQYSPTNSASE